MLFLDRDIVSGVYNSIYVRKIKPCLIPVQLHVLNIS